MFLIDSEHYTTPAVDYIAKAKYKIAKSMMSMSNQDVFIRAHIVVNGTGHSVRADHRAEPKCKP